METFDRAEIYIGAFASVAIAIMFLLRSRKRVLAKEASSNPLLQGENRIPAHSTLCCFEDENRARMMIAQPKSSPNVLSLNGEWLFSLHMSLQSGLEHVGTADNENRSPRRNNSSTRSSQWQKILVPGNWQLQTAGDFPVYTNVKYVVPVNPPHVPAKNPTGVFVKDFVLPAQFKGRRLVVSFGGVDNAIFLWCNSSYIGFSKDSKLPAEFDITAKCLPGQNRIEAVVPRFTDGFYLEDQDMLNLNGIFRDVLLYSFPRDVQISDYQWQGSVDRITQVASIYIDVQLRWHDCSLFPRNATLQTSSSHSSAGSSILVACTLYEEGSLVRSVVDEHGDFVFTFDQSSDHVVAAASEYAALPLDDHSSTNWTRLSLGFHSPISWSAEKPHLYTLIISLRDVATLKVIQVESSRIGLRTVDIYNGLLRMDQRPLTIRGVNYHEHDPITGHYVHPRAIETDIVLMKRNNFNAIRTSHYPQPSWFYELCSLYGMYVIDEANIETHGMKPSIGRLANDPMWRKAFFGRLCRMFQRDKCHTCIVGWSLGNESGYGKIHEELASWLRQRDPTRFVAYEPASFGGREQNRRSSLINSAKKKDASPTPEKTVRFASGEAAINSKHRKSTPSSVKFSTNDKESDGGDGQPSRSPQSDHAEDSSSFVSSYFSMFTGNFLSWGSLVDSFTALEQGGEMDEKAAQNEQSGTAASVVATDVLFPMYARIADCVSLANRFPDMPLVLCEYSHMMGNSGGNLDKYWKAFRSFPRLQGGFIWDWVDQGVRIRDACGKAKYAYGGDFGEADGDHDGNFCLNGLNWPDRGVRWRLLGQESTRQQWACVLVNRPSFGLSDTGVASWRRQKKQCLLTDANTVVVVDDEIKDDSIEPITPRTLTVPFHSSSVVIDSVVSKPVLLEAKQCMKNFECSVKVIKIPTPFLSDSSISRLTKSTSLTSLKSSRDTSDLPTHNDDSVVMSSLLSSRLRSARSDCELLQNDGTSMLRLSQDLDEAADIRTSNPAVQAADVAQLQSNALLQNFVELRPLFSFNLVNLFDHLEVLEAEVQLHGLLLCDGLIVSSGILSSVSSGFQHHHQHTSAYMNVPGCRHSLQELTAEVQFVLPIQKVEPGSSCGFPSFEHFVGNKSIGQDLLEQLDCLSYVVRGLSWPETALLDNKTLAVVYHMLNDFTVTEESSNHIRMEGTDEDVQNPQSGSRTMPKVRTVSPFVSFASLVSAASSSSSSNAARSRAHSIVPPIHDVDSVDMTPFWTILENPSFPNSESNGFSGQNWSVVVVAVLRESTAWAKEGYPVGFHQMNVSDSMRSALRRPLNIFNLQHTISSPLKCGTSSNAANASDVLSPIAALASPVARSSKNSQNFTPNFALRNVLSPVGAPTVTSPTKIADNWTTAFDADESSDCIFSANTTMNTSMQVDASRLEEVTNIFPEEASVDVLWEKSESDVDSECPNILLCTTVPLSYEKSSSTSGTEVKNAYRVRICGSTGLIHSYSVGDVNLLGSYSDRSPPTCRFQLHRTPTDNDKIGYLPRWKDCGLDSEMAYDKFPSPKIPKFENESASSSRLIPGQETILERVSVRRLAPSEDGSDGVICKWRLIPSRNLNRWRYRWIRRILAFKEDSSEFVLNCLVSNPEEEKYIHQLAAVLLLPRETVKLRRRKSDFCREPGKVLFEKEKIIVIVRLRKTPLYMCSTGEKAEQQRIGPFGAVAFGESSERMNGNGDSGSSGEAGEEIVDSPESLASKSSNIVTINGKGVFVVGEQSDDSGFDSEDDSEEKDDEDEDDEILSSDEFLDGVWEVDRNSHFKFQKQKGSVTVEVEYSMSLTGELSIKVNVDTRQLILPVARIGLQLTLDESMYSQLTWFGRGPHECYPDRKASGVEAVHSAPLDALQVPLIVPGEGGCRTDVAWVLLTRCLLADGGLVDRNAGSSAVFDSGVVPAGKKPSAVETSMCGPGDAQEDEPANHFTSFGLLIYSAQSNRRLHFSARPHESSEIALCSNQALLEYCNRNYTLLNVDGFTMGVGGDDSWTASVHDEFLISPGVHVFTLKMRPVGLT